MRNPWHNRWISPESFLNEGFDRDSFDRRLAWLNEPRRWSIDAGSSALVIEAETDTDFWRRTHYGFEADSGHLLSAAVAGNFAVTTKVKFFHKHQYDQAGLMIRVDAASWIKTSVEYELNEASKLGVVVTNRGYSDWSLQDFDSTRNELWLRIFKTASDCIVDHSADGLAWHTIRVAHLDVPPDAVLHCGLYACSPKGSGFRADFDFLRIDSA